jgi:hypothetical protein
MGNRYVTPDKRRGAKDYSRERRRRPGQVAPETPIETEDNSRITDQSGNNLVTEL